MPRAGSSVACSAQKPARKSGLAASPEQVLAFTCCRLHGDVARFLVTESSQWTILHRARRLHGRTHIAALGRTARDPARFLSILGTAVHAELVGVVDVRDHRRSGSFQLCHLRTVDGLALSSTSPTRCPFTGIGRRHRRIRRLHERIRPPTRKNNATNDFQPEISISNSLSNSGTHATNVGESGRLSGGPETSLPMIVGWCWKCTVG
jgi:hypothetical protein